MKNDTQKSILLWLFLALLITSCSKDEPIKDFDKQKVEEQKGQEQSGGETDEENQNVLETTEEQDEADGFKLADIKKPVDGGRVALAVKFSGQYCPPCGDVADDWDEAPHKYKNLIVATLHPFEGYSPEFYNREAGAYANALGCRGIPNVFANLNGDKVSAWNTARMLPYTEQKPNISSVIRCKQSDNKVSLRIKSDNLEGKSYTSVKALIWVLEDGIKAYQTKHRNYTHNHVFRSAPLGLWGQNYKVGAKQEFSFDLPNNVQDKTKIELVYILLNSQREIIYVTKFPLK